MRINQGQEFVIGGYTLGAKHFDALVFGYYEDGKLLYAARTRNGFTPASRGELQKRFARTRDRPMPVRQSARGAQWTMGPGSNR